MDYDLWKDIVRKKVNLVCNYLSTARIPTMIR
jgi:hypothetical protein